MARSIARERDAFVSLTRYCGTAVIVTTQAPNTYDVNWTSRARGRVGYAFDNWLFFIAGGFAVADFDFHEGAITTTVGAKYTGWSIGGGAEMAITQNLVGRIEYLYDDFGHKDYIGSTGDPYRVFVPRPDRARCAGVEI